MGMKAERTSCTDQGASCWPGRGCWAESGLPRQKLHAVSCKGLTGLISLMLNGPKNYLGRVRHKVQCAWDKSDSVPCLPSPNRDVWHSKKCPETKIINALSPSRRSNASLSSRNIAQQTRFIYQSLVRLGHTLLLSITTFNQLIVSECLCDEWRAKTGPSRCWALPHFAWVKRTLKERGRGRTAILTHSCSPTVKHPNNPSEQPRSKSNQNTPDFRIISLCLQLTYESRSVFKLL